MTAQTNKIHSFQKHVGGAKYIRSVVRAVVKHAKIIKGYCINPAERLVLLGVIVRRDMRYIEENACESASVKAFSSRQKRSSNSRSPLKTGTVEKGGDNQQETKKFPNPRKIDEVAGEAPIDESTYDVREQQQQSITTSQRE